MANFFDQFDAAPSTGNFFDQFDEKPQKPEESGFLRQAADIPLSVGRGALTGVRLIADAFGAGSRASEAIKGAEGYLAGLMSAQAKNDEQEIARIMKDAEDKGVLDQVKAGLQAFSVAPADLIAQGLGTAAPAILGMLGGKVLGAGALGARVISGGVGAGMGAGTIKGGIYEATKEELMKVPGMTEEKAEAAAQEAQAYGGKNLDQILIGTGIGGAASVLGVESMAKNILYKAGLTQAGKKGAAEVAEEIAKRGAMQRARELGVGAASEAAPEFVQAGQEQVAQNIALQREGFDVPTFRGAVGAGTLEALAGAGLGGAFGAAEGSLRSQAREEAQRILAEEEKQRVEAERLAAEKEAAQPVVEEPDVAVAPEPAIKAEPIPPVEPVKKEQPKAEEWDEDYTANLPAEAGIFFQNRDRSSPASVGQMRSIAADPDYSRLSVGRDFGSGAPVVITDLPISEDRFGKTAYATASDGTRIPVRYAVVEGSEITPSNTADGTKNSEYGDLSVAAIRPIAGNGRVAGLRAAYDQGTAGLYKQELLSDTEHGIDPGVIGELENPVLVRVMPKSKVAANIADISNISGTLRLSPVEAAKNDIKRVDLNGLTFNDDGSPNTNTLIQFVRSMPKDEQGELIDSKGMPNTKAIDRLNNAIFYKAYGSDSLIELYAQAADPEAKAVLNALAKAAPKMAALEGAGDFDVRSSVLDAAEMAVNARRAGQKLKDYAQQGVLGADPYALKVLDMFADNSRSSKRMAEALDRLATKAGEQASAASTDMFGDVPKMPKDDLYKALVLEPEAEPDLFAQPVAAEPKAPAKPAEPTYAKADKPKFTISKSPEQIGKEIQGLSIPALAKWAVDNAPNEAAKAIATKVDARINEFATKNVYPEKVRVLNNNQRWKSGTRGKVDLISAKGVGLSMKMGFNGTENGNADRRTGIRYATILHELIHAATVPQIFFAPNSKSVNDLKVLYKKVSDQIKQDQAAGKDNEVIIKIKRGSNTMQNPAELMAWGLTDSDFQKYLAGIKVGDKTAFEKLVDVIRQVLGLSKDYESALDSLVKITGEMMDVSLADVETDMKPANIPLKGIKTKGRKLILPESAGEVTTENFETTEAAEPAEPKVPVTRQNIFGEPVLGAWNIQTDPKVEIQDGLIYKLLDKNIDVKRIVQAVKSTGKQIASALNPYLQEELYHGRVANAIAEFQDSEMTPLLKDMDRLGVTIGQLEQYLHNRHAPDYNRVVASRNPDRPEMQDGGSKINTADALKYMDSLDPETKAKYEELAARIDRITKGTRKLLADTGYEKAETIKGWEDAFPFYVPLMREEADFDYNFGSFGTGRGFDVRRDFSRSAMGSKRNVVDIIGNVIAARNNAIMLTEKNRVAQAVYGLALEAPNPDFWLAINPDAEKMPQDAIDELRAMGLDEEAVKYLMKEPRQRVLDPKKNEITSRINTKLRENDYVLATRINGEKRYVFFNPRDERAKRAATALKNLDAQDLGTVLGLVATATRWMASVNTQYNPIFGPYNFLRDVQGAALQLSTTPLAGMQKEVGKNIVPALRVIYSSLRKRRKGEKVDGELADLWKEFQKEGGQTGFRDNFSRTQDRTEALIKELNRIQEGKFKANARAVFDWLSDYNDSLENATRLAAYKVAKEKFIKEGMDLDEAKQQAASVAKNLTVNFNRKGDVATQMGALYAFFNASMQGTARMIETLKGPAGKKIMAGGLLLGAMQAAMMAAAGFDDDEPRQFIRERNIIIPTWDGKYVAFPMPLGFHVIPNFSRIITEWTLSGFDNTADRVADLTGLFLDAFNPVGNAGWSAQTFSPTVVDPIVAIFENKDWTGKPISREDIFSLRPTPGYTRAREGANFLTTEFAKFLNYASGGDADRKGIISPTPEQIEYLIGQAFGGVGREATKLATSIEKTITGEDLPPYKIPLYGRFVGETKSSAAESNKFYKNMMELNELRNVIDGRRERREPLGDFMRENPEARLLPLANRTYSDIQKLRKRREALVERGAPREAVKQVEMQITRRMQVLNDRVSALKD